RDSENQKVAFMKTNHLPSTSFQIKSTQDELSRIEKSQNDLRESLLYIKQFKLTDTESFEALKFIHHTLTYSAKFDTKKREEEFKKFLDKKEKSSIVIEAKL
ncbi:MAG: hypothetical protein J0647_03950, partial [Campylobacteraceae bacterium]|nr:hypothetical protein [Campylobacteraceae bacterium]